MQDRDHSCLGAQVFGIRGDVADGLSGRLEKDVIDDRLVLETDRRDRRGHGEDDMEIGNGQQLRLAVGEPLEPRQPLALRTMSIAASNGRSPLLALWVKFVMVSQQASILIRRRLEAFGLPITTCL